MSEPISDAATCYFVYLEFKGGVEYVCGQPEVGDAHNLQVCVYREEIEAGGKPKFDMTFICHQHHKFTSEVPSA